MEIAVISTSAKSKREWSKNLETQFRTTVIETHMYIRILSVKNQSLNVYNLSCLQIETFSKVNHKNFVSLIGFCEEDEPFTRMMVFEYAPNGTLYEHLHGKYLESS